MEYSGLIQKYKINRPLTEEDRALQLQQKERLDIEPHYHLAVTRLNSTYLETVDKYYEHKGELSFWMLAVIVVLFFFIALFVLGAITRNPDSGVGDTMKDWLSVVFIIILFSPLLWLSIWALFKESFAYTHYPIRLNRKDRNVYVFRLDGSVLVAPWDETFFTLGRGTLQFGGKPNWDIRGHILDADGVTVRDTFAFAMHWHVQNDVRRHWEYLRRYMEEGPEKTLSETPVYLPIVSEYESYAFGLMRLIATLPGSAVGQLIMLPFSFLFSLGRYFAMRTSDIPVWTKKVEIACAITPDDPYERDARNNPPNFWKST